MWEFEILDNYTGEREIIFGYSFSDALRRSHLDNTDNRYSCLLQEYVD